jgi:hypothetical protein
MADAQLSRTMAAQRDQPFDWIGVMAGELMESLLDDAEASGTLSFVTTHILRLCLPGLERHIEGMCPAGMQLTSAGLCTPYGFPRTLDYPMIIAVLNGTGDPAEPVAAATLSGTIKCWPSERPAGTAKQDWKSIIDATAQGNWPAASSAVTAWLARQPGAIGTITEHFAAHRDPTKQLVVAVLAGGDADGSVGVACVIALPGFELPTDAISIKLAGAA